MNTRRVQKIRVQVSDKIPGQVAFWNCAAPFTAFVGGLGSGKTFAGATKAIMAPPRTRGMIVAPTFPQLRDSAQSVFFEIAEQIPGYIIDHNKSENITRTIDGKTILWRSGEKPTGLRGPNLTWIWGDEWAFAREEAHKIVVGRARVGRPQVWFTTTPNGLNWFYKEVTNPALKYSVFHADTRDNPFNAASYAGRLEAQYADDPEFADQELRGRFVDMGGSRYYAPTLVDSCSEFLTPLAPPALPAVVETVDGVDRAFTIPAARLRLYRPPTPGVAYVIGADCAEGVNGGDDTAFVVVSALTGDVCAILAGEFEPQFEAPALGAALARWYNAAAVLPERNNHGHAVIAGLRRHKVRVLAGLDSRPGWSTHAQSKADMASRSRAALMAYKTDAAAPIADPRLARQIKSIERATLKAPGKGRKSKVDDEWIAWALAECARTLQAQIETTGPLVAPPTPRRIPRRRFN